MKKRHAGRPPKSGDETLSERLELRITASEKIAYEKASQDAGMERSDWIRAVLNSAVRKKRENSADRR
jgi:hypothetical protein